MKKSYDNILFHESGESIPLSADDLIDYLLQNLYNLRRERDYFEGQLHAIQKILIQEKQGII